MAGMYATLTILFVIFEFCFGIVSSQVVKPPTKLIIGFCAGGEHACAVFDNKKMKCWGSKFSWGLASGLSDYLSDIPLELGDAIPYIDVGASVNVEKVSCGYQHICMKLDTGDIKCLGRNADGQIGIGLPTSITPIGSWNGYIGDNLPVVNLGSGLKIIDLALGQYHACVLLSGNKVKCFGSSIQGQLGLGVKTNRGSSPSQMGNNLPFINLGSGVEIASIHSSSSAYHNCIILSLPAIHAQRIKCWGYNDVSQLGYGDTSDRGDDSYEMGDNLTLIDLGTESRVQQIALSQWHSCILLINDGLKCFGKGQNGQLGSGATTSISSIGNSLPTVLIDSGKTIRYLTAGFLFTCIIYNDMVTMKCIGFNDYGQLGQGDKISRGNTPTTMIPNISAIDLGTGSLPISVIYSGMTYNCIVFIDNSVKCFGYNSNAQFVIGSVGNSIGDGPGEMGIKLQYSVLFSPTKSPSNSPTLAPTKTPTMDPTFPTTSPTDSPSDLPTLIPTGVPSRTPTTKIPTRNPTKSPTSKCDYQSAKLCKYDIKCMWKKINGVKSCIWFDCTILNQNKCGKERARCKWNRKASMCDSKTT